jgi:hypothetical protein
MKYLKLTKLPNAKELEQFFTIGRSYCILGSIGNGYIIENDQGIKSIVLKESFSEVV